MDEALQEAVRELLEEQIERLLETLLKEIAGVNAQVSLLQGLIGCVGAGRTVGTSGDIAELITAATARGGRFF